MRVSGKIGEEKAVQFLRRKGYKILERNFFTRYGEIDIVAEKEGVIVFVEVKSSSGWESEQNFTQSKAKRVYKSALIYLSSKDLEGFPFRFDFIAINGDEIRHYENVLGEDGNIG